MTEEEKQLLEDLRVRLAEIAKHSCTPQLKLMVTLAQENLEELAKSLGE